MEIWEMTVRMEAETPIKARFCVEMLRFLSDVCEAEDTVFIIMSFLIGLRVLWDKS